MLTIRDMWQSMRAILRRARQIVGAELAALHLTNAEGDVLFHLLGEAGGLSQEQLAERLDVNKAAISRTVDSLVHKGYVLRQRQPDDARAYCVSLSDGARQVSATIEQIYESLYARIKQGITEEDFGRLGAVLGAVYDNLHTPRGSL